MVFPPSGTPIRKMIPAGEHKSETTVRVVLDDPGGGGQNQSCVFLPLLRVILEL